MTLRFPTFRPSYIGEPSRPCGFFGPSAYTRRKSGRLVLSTRSTVAPCSAKYRVAIGPAAPDPNSRIFSPSHAGPPAAAASVGAIVAASAWRIAPTRPSGVVEPRVGGGGRRAGGRGVAVGGADDGERPGKALVVADRAEEPAGLELRARVAPRAVSWSARASGWSRTRCRTAPASCAGRSTRRRRPRSRAASRRRRCWGSTTTSPSPAASGCRRGGSAARGSRRAPCRRAARSSRSRRGVGQISRVRPMFAPRRAPRNPVSGKRAGVAMFATNTTSCIDTSTICGRPDRERGERGERGLGPGVRVRRPARRSGPAADRDRRCSTGCRSRPSPRGRSPANPSAARRGRTG